MTKARPPAASCTSWRLHRLYASILLATTGGLNGVRPCFRHTHSAEHVYTHRLPYSHRLTTARCRSSLPRSLSCRWSDHVVALSRRRPSRVGPGSRSGWRSGRRPHLFHLVLVRVDVGVGLLLVDLLLVGREVEDDNLRCRVLCALTALSIDVGIPATSPVAAANSRRDSAET